jgi:hypothetical protein
MPQPQIYWAIYYRRLDIAQYLLAHNQADVDAPYERKSALIQRLMLHMERLYHGSYMVILFISPTKATRDIQRC